MPDVLKPIESTWRMIVKVLGPVIDPFVRPLQRWDDRRRARRLREIAVVIAPLRPEEADRLILKAEEFERPWRV